MIGLAAGLLVIVGLLSLVGIDADLQKEARRERD